MGYIQIKNFDKQTTPSLRAHLARLRQENGDKKLAALILDFRGNNGGLLQQAIEMCDLFLEGGDIVSQATRGVVDRRATAHDDDIEPDYPILLLADESSASGAEIVVGALQKNNRGIVIGTSTFGKGSVQQLHGLSNEAQLKITVSEYLLPGDISIQENGVVPDILAQPVVFFEEKAPESEADGEGEGDDAQKDGENDDQKNDGDEKVVETDDGDASMYTEFNLFPDQPRHTEKNYRAHIVSRFAKEEEPKFTIPYFLEIEEEDPDSDAFISGDLQPKKDTLVQMALGVLQIAPRPFVAGRTLRTKREEIEQLKERLFVEIVQKLQDKGIDWSDGPEPDSPKVEIALSRRFVEEPSTDPEDKVPVRKLLLTARCTNQGEKPLYRVKGLTESEHFRYREREFLFGKLEPGQTVEREVKVVLPYFPRARDDELTLEVSGASGTVYAETTAGVQLEDRGQPSFAYEAELIDAGNEQPLATLKPGVDVRLRLKVKNTGNATAHKGAAILRNETGRQVFLETGRIEYADLKPGADETVEFRFQVRDGEKVDRYEFELVIVDSYSGAVLTRDLSIPVDGSGGAAPFPNGELFSQPSIALRALDPQTKKDVLVTESASLELDSLIRSPTGTPFQAWVVTTLLGSNDASADKVYFRDSEGLEKLEFLKQIPLKRGTNLVTVYVKDRNGLASRKSLVVRQR